MDDHDRTPPTVTFTMSLDGGRVITIEGITDVQMVRLEELGAEVRRAAERFVAVASGTFDMPRESYDRLRRALEELEEVRMRRSLWSRPWSWGESWPYRDPFYLEVAHWEELAPRRATLARHASNASRRIRVHDARIVGARSSCSSRRCTHRPWPARHRRRARRVVVGTVLSAEGVSGGWVPHAATSLSADSGQRKTGT